MWPEATDFRLSENSAVVCPTSPSTKKSEVLTTLEKKAMKTFVGKGKNAGNSIICFSLTYHRQNTSFQKHLTLCRTIPTFNDLGK